MADQIVIQHISKSYGDREVLHDLSFAVREGEIVGLLGVNGAGKSTTQRLLFGLVTPTRGQITVAGLDPAASPLEVKRIAGYAPEEPAFYDYLSAAESLDFAAQVRGLHRTVARARLRPVIEALDFESSLPLLVRKLSHGTKKKLALLLALQHEPRVLLLDEPTNGLDPLSADELHTILRERAARGAAVLVSTHLLSPAELLCDRLVVLNQGRVMVEGSAQILRQRARAGGGTLEQVFVELIRAQ